MAFYNNNYNMREYDGTDEEPSYGEQGSGFTFDRLFEEYDNGKVFVPSSSNIKDYKDMLDTDGKAASIEKLLTYPIIAAPKELKEPKKDKGQTQFIYDLFFRSNEYNDGMVTDIDMLVAQMNFAQTISRTYFEKVWDVRERDGANILRKIAWRPPETCQLALNAGNSEVIGFRQEPLNLQNAMNRNEEDDKWKFFGRRKSFIYVHGLWRDPIDGFSAMQVPYWCWSTKRKIRYLWYQFLETSVLPKTIVKNQDIEEAKANARRIATLKNKDVVGTSADTEIDNIEGLPHGAGQFMEAIRWLESEMSNSVLGGFMDLTSSASSGKGSFALSEDQSKLYLRTRRVVARDQGRQITNQIIGDLVRYNFGRDATIPEFVFGPLDQASQDQVLSLFGTISQSSGNKEMPREFLHQLTIRVATILEMDPDKVQEQLDKMTGDIEDEDQMKLIVASVDAATSMVQAKQAEQDAKMQFNPQMNDPSIPTPPGGDDSGQNSTK